MELRFSSEEKALQYLADITGKRIKISRKLPDFGSPGFGRIYDNWLTTPEEEGPRPEDFFEDEMYEIKKDAKMALENIKKMLKEKGLSDVELNLDFGDGDKLDIDDESITFFDHMKLTVSSSNLKETDEKLESDYRGRGEVIVNMFIDELEELNDDAEEIDYKISENVNENKTIFSISYRFSKGI